MHASNINITSNIIYSLCTVMLILNYIKKILWNDGGRTTCSGDENTCTDWPMCWSMLVYFALGLAIGKLYFYSFSDLRPISFSSHCFSSHKLIFKSTHLLVGRAHTHMLSCNCGRGFILAVLYLCLSSLLYLRWKVHMSALHKCIFS